MPAVAAIRLDVTANTAEATRSVDALQEKLKSFQASLSVSASSFESRWEKTSAERRLTMGLGVMSAGFDVAASVASRSGGNERLAAGLRDAANSARQFATMLAPLGPHAAALGAVAGAATSAVRSFADAAAESAKKAKEAAETERQANLNLVDMRVAHELEWKRATPEQRAKMQYEARERMEEYQYRLDRGASISEKAIFDAANWDPTMAQRMLFAFKRQNGGELTDNLKPLAGAYRWSALERAEADAWRRGGGTGHALSRLISEERGRTGGFTEEKLDIALGKSAHEASFDVSLDALWEQMQAEKNAPKGGTTPSLRTSLAPAGSNGADSLSSVGIGFTGSDPRSREQVDLLQSISDTLNAIRGHGIPAVAV